MSDLRSLCSHNSLSQEQERRREGETQRNGDSLHIGQVEKHPMCTRKAFSCNRCESNDDVLSFRPHFACGRRRQFVCPRPLTSCDFTAPLQGRWTAPPETTRQDGQCRIFGAPIWQADVLRSSSWVSTFQNVAWSRCESSFATQLAILLTGLVTACP